MSSRNPGNYWMYTPTHPMSIASGKKEARRMLLEPHVKAQDRFLRSCAPEKLEKSIQKRIDEIWGPCNG